MAAAIAVQRRLRRQEGRAPNRVAVANVEAATAVVGRNIIITEAGDPPQLGVPVEAVTAAGIADQREKAVAAQIVDPGQGRVRPGDHVFSRLVVKKTEFHNILHFQSVIILKLFRFYCSKTIKFIIIMRSEKGKLFLEKWKYI